MPEQAKEPTVSNPVEAVVSCDLYPKDYEQIGCLALLEEYIENYQTDDDWCLWVLESANLRLKSN